MNIWKTCKHEVGSQETVWAEYSTHEILYSNVCARKTDHISWQQARQTEQAHDHNTNTSRYITLCQSGLDQLAMVASAAGVVACLPRFCE